MKINLNSPFILRRGPQCTGRLGFQIRPLRHPHIYAARAEESSSALLLSLSLPLRGRRSAFVALYGFVYGSVDKAVHALAVGFCVGFDNIFLAFRHSNGNAIKIRSIPFSITPLYGPPCISAAIYAPLPSKQFYYTLSAST